MDGTNELDLTESFWFEILVGHPKCHVQQASGNTKTEI